MANVMGPADEPAKWVCHLHCKFDGKEDLIYGTGFLVNMPDTNMYCIMTAGHNIKRPEGGYATSIEVKFPNTLTFTAHPGEYFVSEIFHKNTTLKAIDDSSISDYGLITVDREKVKAPSALDLRGCAFSVLYSKSSLVNMECTVYGYKKGSSEQTKNTSNFYIVQQENFSYIKETEPGVSGAPVFISQNGSDIAVGIQLSLLSAPSANSALKHATRLTCFVLLEMVSWIKDYGLLRTLEIADRKGVYLHTTRGSRPNILARRSQDGFSTFNFVVVSAPTAKNDARLAHYRFAIVPAQCKPSDERSFYFLTVIREDDNGLLAVLRADTDPGKESTFALYRKGKTENFKLTSGLDSSASLAVRPSSRHACECGCITQDDVVSFHPTVNTVFLLSPKIKDFSPKKA